MDTTLFFDSYYDHAELNCLLKMNCDGTILGVKKAFTKNYGYTNEDIFGKNFSILFNERDREVHKPELELQTVMAFLQAHDEHYVVDKKGKAIWSIGEAVLVNSEDGKQFIIKDIVNLQFKRQLQLFLTETEEVLVHPESISVVVTV